MIAGGYLIGVSTHTTTVRAEYIKTVRAVSAGRAGNVYRSLLSARG